MQLHKNQQLELTVDSFGAQGEGIARWDGMPVFIPRALPGERVRVQIVKADKRFAFGRALEILTPSPDRREPPCPYYVQCGGCVCQHMSYEAQLAFKRSQVAGCMRHIAGIDVEVAQVLGMEEPWHYRNKISMPVSGQIGAPAIGYYAQRSHRVVDVQRCLLSCDAADRACAAVRQWMAEQRVPPYNEESHTGLVRHIMTRVNRAGQLMLVLVINGRQLKKQKELLDLLQKAVPELVSLCVSPNEKRSNVILGDTYQVLWGQERLEDTLCGNRFLLSPLSFFQVNPQQTEKLYNTALDFADLTGGETVADLYCGAGTISLLLARRAAHVTGIEIVPDAIRDARENARRNGVENVDFLCGPAEDILPQLVEKGMRPDVVVLDPPRKGAEPAVLQAILTCAPQRVVYVSCNPATQARDVKILCAGGYQPQRCQPVDMFCQTAGVETVLLMSQQKPDDTIHVGIDLKPEDVTVAESKATYAELQAYIEEKYGFKVSNLYIAQAKAALGIKERENYNKPKNPNSKKLVCPPDKMAAIQEALRHFKMI